MNLAVARITTGSVDDNNCIRIFSWLIFWIASIILEQVLYNKFLSSVKYIKRLRTALFGITRMWNKMVVGIGYCKGLVIHECHQMTLIKFHTFSIPKVPNFIPFPYPKFQISYIFYTQSSKFHIFSISKVPKSIPFPYPKFKISYPYISI